MGKRVGTKKSDRRWVDDNGEEWDSRFESEVYRSLARDGHRIRRADKSDTVVYYTPVKQGRCLECDSNRVVQERTYTSDIFVVGEPKKDPFNGPAFVESKGKFLGPKRELFKHLSRQWAGPPLFIVFQNSRKLPGLKSNGVEWCHRYCKNVTPGIWDAKTHTIEWFPYANT